MISLLRKYRSELLLAMLIAQIVTFYPSVVVARMVASYKPRHAT
jgi:hypothetical protein